MIQNILKLATEQACNPDIKDRAYIYWRMLSTSPAKTLEVVCGVKPEISSDTYNLYDEDLVDKLINGIGGLSSIYHKTQTEWSKEQAKYNKKEEDENLPEIEQVTKKREESKRSKPNQKPE
jgi:vesicle coat complex subunit